jgi:D-glycero-D-manno-heptose 1,7-bisphosphate phosphatase
MKKAVFLDRDGVLNQTFLIAGVPKPPSSPNEVVILKGVTQAVRTLKKNGFELVVVTNQPDVARGLKSKEDVTAINLHIDSILNIRNFYTCFHDDSDNCSCRKPKPGLIYQASIDLKLDISNSFLIGDRWRDITAGQTAGCQTFFIDYSYPEKQPILPYIKVRSFFHAATLIVGGIDGK